MCCTCTLPKVQNSAQMLHAPILLSTISPRIIRFHPLLSISRLDVIIYGRHVSLSRNRTDTVYIVELLTYFSSIFHIRGISFIYRDIISLRGIFGMSPPNLRVRFLNSFFWDFESFSRLFLGIFNLYTRRMMKIWAILISESCVTI